jgi:hypothetical protein
MIVAKPRDSGLCTSRRGELIGRPLVAAPARASADAAPAARETLVNGMPDRPRQTGSGRGCVGKNGPKLLRLSNSPQNLFACAETIL